MSTSGNITSKEVLRGNISGNETLRGNAKIVTVYHTDAYKIAVSNGYKGSIEEWLESLKGDKGDKGDPFTYEDFTKEQLAALKGDKGDTGAQGIQGEKGEKGEKGDTGAKGDKGNKGDPFTYADFTAAQLASLKGAKGDKGETGAQGIRGIQGEKGDKGEPGKDGQDGQPGQDGKDGYTPVKGVDYFDGIDGKDGKDGYTPIKGVDYFDGQPGADGKDYILTDEDRNEIAGIAADMVEVPEGSGGGFDYVAGKSEGTKETIVLEGESVWHYGQIFTNQDTIVESDAYMYTDKIKLNETKTFSFTGLNKNGVNSHIAIRRIVAYDVNGNRLAEHSVNTEITGGAISSMPTRPITMHTYVDSIVLMVYKPFDHTKKTITLDGTDGEAAYCQFAPMRVVSSYDIPVLTLNGDCYGMTKNVSKNLQFTFQGMSGVAEVKLQGSSSINTGKQIGGAFDTDVGGLYNFTIKFPEAFEAKEGWGAQTKYCFKANAIDHSHARNVCSCKLWGQIVKSRPNVPAELSSLPNGGAIDGFPIVIALNGKYYALGTLNIPKDRWMFGNPKAIVCADTHCDATKFKALATLDGDFELEYVEDEANADWVLTSLNTAIQAVMNSDGSDIDTAIGQYIDIPSAIDYYIHTVEESADDGTSKNYLLVTFDGVKWYFSTYDRDTTYGLYWTGETINYQKDGINFVRYAEVHKLMELIYNHKKADLKSRAVALRNNVKSEFNVANVFTKFVGGIPAAIYEQNTKRWPLLRSTSISNVEQILNWYRMRRAYIDKLIDAM